MKFQDAVVTCFKKYITIQGRAPRSEYWYFSLFLFIGSIVVSLLGGRHEHQLFPVGLIFNLATLLPSITVGVRRLHDLGHSGWWFLMIVVPMMLSPLAGRFGPVVILLVLVGIAFFFSRRGTVGDNRFGPDPLGYTE